MPRLVHGQAGGIAMVDALSDGETSVRQGAQRTLTSVTYSSAPPAPDVRPAHGPRRLRTRAVVLVVVGVLIAIFTIYAVHSWTSRDEFSGSCGDAPYKVTRTTTHDSLAVFLTLHITEATPSQKWEVRWSDNKLGTLRVLRTTDTDGQFKVRRHYGDTDDGKFGFVRFRPSGSATFCRAGWAPWS
jgi:hypothetical protein